jgi:[acyl-carrier-protein] S-malonyltransferase
VASRTCFLFPGLGGYIPGALTRLAAEHPAVPAALVPIDQAAREYGHPSVTDLLTDPNGPEIEEVTPIQLHLAVVGASLGVHAVLQVEGITADVVVGHSTGEITALVATGWLAAYDAARILCERQTALGESDSTGGLVALHVGAERAQQLCGATGDWTLSVALFNSPRQTVVAGREPGLSAVEALARTAGVPATRLAVPVPHHSPLLARPARRLAEANIEYPIGVARCRVYSPILRRYITDAADVRALIAANLVDPVYFTEAVHQLYGPAEVDRFIEVGARSIGTDLVAETLPADVTTIAPLRRRAGLDELLTALGEPGAGGTQTAPRRADKPVGGNGAAAHQKELPPQPDMRAQPVPPAATSVLPPRPQLHAELRQLFADVLGYPEDVFEDDANLEADLGVASVRKTELLVKVLDRYGLPTPTSEIRMRDYNTLPKLVDLVYHLAQQPRTTNA